MKLFNFSTSILFQWVRYLSIYKIVNLIKLRISYLFSRLGFQPIWNIYPHFISIETTNFCNLHCPECPVGSRNESKTTKSSFDFALYKRLITELKPSLQHVMLYFQGEPFLNTHLMEFIRHAHDANIYTSVSTNGQFLNEKTAKEIVMSGLDKLIVSMDGTTQEVYQTYRVGGSLLKAIDGVKYLVEWKKELKSKTPMIEIQFLVLKTNEHQMNDMRELSKSMKVDRLSFKSAQLYDFENGNELLTTKKNFSRYMETKEGTFIIKGQQPNRCWRLWSGAVINVTGEVLPCCFDKGSEYTFGNINDRSFSECWQGSKAHDFRQRIITNRKQFDMCRNCW